MKVLYVTGLSHTASEEVLKDRFSPYGVVDSVKKIKNYAFVHFQQRDDALQVRICLLSHLLLGHTAAFNNEPSIWYLYRVKSCFAACLNLLVCPENMLYLHY